MAVQVIFLETPVFKEGIQKLMPDDTYAESQQLPADHPDADDAIQDIGGIRKV